MEPKGKGLLKGAGIIFLIWGYPYHNFWSRIVFDSSDAAAAGRQP